MVLDAVAEFVKIINSNSALAALLSAAITSYCSYRLAVRRERLSRNAEKAFDTYDKALSILSEFRIKPSLALEDDYYLRLMGLSVSLRAYGNKKVYDAMEGTFDKIKMYHEQFSEEIRLIEEQCVDWDKAEDPSTGEVVDVPILLCPEYEHDKLCKDAKQRNTPSQHAAKEIVDSFADKLSKIMRKS